MEHRSLVELLAVHSEQLDPKSIDSMVSGDLSTEQRSELGSLLRLAAQVKEALAPVCPSPSFRQQLRTNLTEMARRRKTGDITVDVPTRPRELLIGAALGSAVALAGGIAYLIRVRSHARS